MRAATKHASLATAQNYLHNPPNVLQRNGLLTQIKTMQHGKGPAWICQNGIDKNLGSTNQRSNNNNLTIMLEDDNDSVEIIDNAKMDSIQTNNIGKVKRMQTHCRAAMEFKTPLKDLPPDEQTHQNELKKAMRFYSEKIREGEDACKTYVVDMIDGTGEDWEKGMSQSQHEAFQNIEGYNVDN